jgi:hypothetical protein
MGICSIKASNKVAVADSITKNDETIRHTDTDSKHNLHYITII